MKIYFIKTTRLKKSSIVIKFLGRPFGRTNYKIIEF